MNSFQADGKLSAAITARVINAKAGRNVLPDTKEFASLLVAPFGENRHARRGRVARLEKVLARHARVVARQARGEA